ncbi:MAG: 2-oxoisovalerate dehydrogenase [Chloroflexi bacterium]|nr:2-oxoisovalerate dehydrogenase [Chloroflexota bacterium]
MASELIFEVHETEEGGYYALAVGHDTITQGDTWDELKVMVQDAVLRHVEDHEMPGTFRLRRVDRILRNRDISS